MKSFLLPVGRAAGASLATVVSALSCGAALPVSGLDIFWLTDTEEDPVLPALIDDLNQASSLLSETGGDALFPSSFRFETLRPRLPSLRELCSSPAAEALLSALRGKGVPLSYKTDREAVEWAFSSLLSERGETLSGFFTWTDRIPASADEGRVALLCDLCDPFSAGAAFSLLRFFREERSLPSSMVSLFCLARRSIPPLKSEIETLSSAILAMDAQKITAAPAGSESACADYVWLLSMPASLVRTDEACRVMYVVLARRLASFFSGNRLPAPGLHTAELPGIITFQSLGDQAKSFASFVHTAVWLLADLFPAVGSFCDHPGALRSLAPNTRSGLFKRLFRTSRTTVSRPEELPLLDRVFRAVLSEVTALIRFMPDQFRLAEVSDPLWKKVTDACGRTITVAAEYDVSVAETEEAGIMNIKPVHRVSLSDTEEEKQLRRLEEIGAQLKEETELRDSAFAEVGGSCAWTALLDCRSRCGEALRRAEENAEALAMDPSAEHLSVAACARRVRLLKAAVSRCTAALADPELLRRLSEPSAAASVSVSPFAGQMLSAAAAEKIACLLTAEEDTAEALRKDIRSLQPDLFFGFHLSDNKTLLRALLSSCMQDPSRPPLVSLVQAAHAVSRDETAPLRFLSAGELPSVPLLPDLYPELPPLSVSALLPLLPAGTIPADTVAEKRGILALLLLRQYRRRVSGDASVSMEFFRSGDSPALSAWLSGRGTDEVRILSLGTPELRLPFALVLPGVGLLPARLTPAHFDILPSFAVPWADRENKTFRDPCTLLSEGDREILLDRMERIREALPAASRMHSFLESFSLSLLREKEPVSPPEQLPLLLKAAFGLRLLPAFGETLVRETCFYEHFLPADDVASALAGRDAVPPSPCAVPEDIVYLYRGVPFSRENSRTLLQYIPLPAQEWILSLMEKDCDTLSSGSDLYHDALVRELSLLLERFPDALPEARQKAMDLLDQSGKPVTDTVTELTWPWDPASPAIRTILSESLGEALAEAALRPFTDCLALFPARGSDVIGDSLLSSMCRLDPVSAAPAESEEMASVMPDAVLPPVSGALSSAFCCLPEGRVLLRPGLFSFERVGEGRIKATLTLDGRFPVRMVRVYDGEEILNLYSHEIPTMAVWPNLPFAPEDWHAYYTYAALPEGFSFTVSASDGSELSPEASGRCVVRTGTFPQSFAFFRDGRSFGSLPNLLPSPEIVRSEPCEACVDFGSVGTSVVLSAARRRRPLQGPTLVRTLLNNPASSRDLLRKEFLPAVPVSALLPTASRLFRNVPGEDPLPFEDGIVLMSSDLQDALSIPPDTFYTCLKWESEKGRSVALCLHQIMLMTALQARTDGMSSLTWRFAVPDEMAKEGRQRLVDLFTSLAEKTSLAAGFPVPENAPLVTFAAESSALGAYFRLCSSEDTRGGFMVLDIGACTADISLFLRGREQAVRSCQVPLGIHYMLLPSLLRDPSLLRQDLGFVQDPSFLRDLSLLEQILQEARSESSALRKARLALDSFIADRRPQFLPALLFNPATGMPSRLGSVLLFHFSFLMMLSGLVLLQIAADPGKNDFLPEQMSLCLSGRGSILLEDLPEPFKTGLWHFLTMFRNRRVASLSLLFSSEKKMEIPVGLSILESVSTDLPPASAVPAAISVRPEELLPQFLLRFRKEFPASAEVLFGGFFTNDFYHPFSPLGESVVSAAIAQSFTEQTSLRPYDALSGWIGSLLELVSSPA